MSGVVVHLSVNGARVPVELDANTLATIAAAIAPPAAREPPPSPYMTIPEAAEHLRCKRQRIDDLLSARRLTRYKDGARTLVSRTEIEEYVRGGRCSR